ncbi:MAG: transposase, partial [bacterium]|nr:transposase [bacterium]
MERKHPFAVGQIHHVYNRGVAKAPICREEADYWRFLQGLCFFNDEKSASSILWHLERDRARLTMNVLKEYIIAQGSNRRPLVRILAYCVMGNHYHLLLEEIEQGGITQFMHKLGTGYAKYFNKKHDRVGSLFQNVFKNVLVDDELYLQYLLVYINVLNPVSIIEPNWKQEGIQDIKKALDFASSYQWGSHMDYLGKRGSLILHKGVLGEFLAMPQAYLNLVTAVLEGKKYGGIEHLTLE